MKFARGRIWDEEVGKLALPTAKLTLLDVRATQGTPLSYLLYRYPTLESLAINSVTAKQTFLGSMPTLETILVKYEWPSTYGNRLFDINIDAIDLEHIFNLCKDRERLPSLTRVHVSQITRWRLICAGREFLDWWDRWKDRLLRRNVKLLNDDSESDGE